MRRHRWLRRIVILTLLLVIGVVVLSPDHKMDFSGIVDGELQAVDIGEEAEEFLDEAKQKYQQYSTEFVEEANDAINEAVESAVESASESFFDSMKKAAADFFQNLLPE